MSDTTHLYIQIMHARTRQGVAGPWPVTALVGDIAHEVARRVGYVVPDGSVLSLQRHEDGVVLDPRKSLAEAGVAQSEKLELTSWGDGV